MEATIKITIKFTYEGKKYTKKAYLTKLASGAYVVNIKKDDGTFDVSDFDDEWSIFFYDDKYIFEVIFEKDIDSEEEEYYTFNPKKVIVWEEGVDVILDEIEIESLKVS